MIEISEMKLGVLRGSTLADKAVRPPPRLSQDARFIFNV